MRGEREAADRLVEAFERHGAARVETDVLQPAGTLLDLYGEDIRARAYVTQDPLRGERMLRPDFTVPVVQAHMAEGAEPARYTYAGKVFRRQEEDEARASEYYQVGYEVFDRADPAAADAEVFALIADALEGLPVVPVTGDIGVLMAAVAGLETTERRRAALMRHVWRPQRFRALLERFSRPAVARDFAQAQAPLVGLRSEAEIAERVAWLRADAEAAPIAAEAVAGLDAVASVRGPAGAALATLQGLAARMPAIREAVARLEARMTALEARGVDAGALAFEGSYGRTSMEYYDGFVFGFLVEGLPPVATGGRYDALTRVLGQGREIPAVGGVIRPGLVSDLREARA